MEKLHPRAVWLFFLSSMISWMIFLLIFLWAFVFLFFTAGYGAASLGIWLLLLIFIAVLAFVVAKLTYHFYRYELTKNGFKKEHGIIWKKYVTIPYDRIQNIDIYRGILARILGLSDLQIQTAGGITSGSYGAFSEGRLPGLSRQTAEKLRDELVRRAHHHKGQGL